MSIFLLFYTRWYGRFCPRSSFDAKENFDKVTIFSSTALGDFLLNTPAIKAIRRRYPAAEITLIASPKNKTLVAYDQQHCAMYDHVVYWDNKARSLLTLVKAMRTHGKPDLTVILHSRDPYDVAAAIMAGTKYIFRDNLMDLTDLHEFNRWITNYTTSFYGHYIRRKLDLVSLLNAPVNDTSMTLPFSVEPVTRDSNIRYIGFQLGASKEKKTWPIEYYATLANQLLATHSNIELIIIGTPAERILFERLMNLINSDAENRVTDYVGKTNMYQLAHVIARMDLLVTGDTGPLHIAIALKVKTVSLFINTNPHETCAYQDSHLHTKISPTHQILQIEKLKFGARGIIQPDEVLESINEMLLLNQPEL